MPQCTNRRASDNPYGKGSIPNELQEVTFRTRRRAAKINESEDHRRKVYTKMLEKHHNAQTERNAKVVARVRHSLKELEAYRDVLQSYRANKFTTLQWGYKPRQINTPNTFKRCQLETRVYNCGFSMDSLYPEVKQMIENNRPEKKKGAMIQKIISIAQRRSDFEIDRRITNVAKRREDARAVLSGTALYPYDGQTKPGADAETIYRLTQIAEQPFPFETELPQPTPSPEMRSPSVKAQSI